MESILDMRKSFDIMKAWKASLHKKEDDMKTDLKNYESNEE